MQDAGLTQPSCDLWASPAVTGLVSGKSLCLARESRENIAFVTSLGVYVFRDMPFRLSSVPLCDTDYNNDNILISHTLHCQIVHSLTIQELYISQEMVANYTLNDLGTVSNGIYRI